MQIRNEQEKELVIIEQISDMAVVDACKMIPVDAIQPVSTHSYFCLWELFCKNHGSPEVTVLFSPCYSAYYSFLDELRARGGFDVTCVSIFSNI